MESQPLLDSQAEPLLRDAAVAALRSISGEAHGDHIEPWQAWWQGVQC